MKVFIQSPDDKGRINGTIQEHLLNYFPNRMSSPSSADVCIVPISFFSDYKINPKLLEIQIPWVMLDFMEYEWCYFNEGESTHLFGRNTKECRWLNPNWYPFDSWVK